MKISIIGTGRLGGFIAFLIADRGLADELVLIDMNKAGAEGQALDLKHAFLKSDKLPKIYAGDYSATHGSDIVIITAGKPRTAAMASRADLLADNAKIITGVAHEMKLHCKDAILITTTNPTDAINYILWKETGFAREKIIGFGGLLDSGRIRAIISEELNVPANSIVCDVIGEHGENMTPIFSKMAINGKPAVLTIEQKEKIRKRLLGIAKEVIEKKGATEYGPVSHLLRIVESIVNDKKDVLLCSCIMRGQYSIDDVSLGVPAIIGKRGIEKIEIWQIDPDEHDRLRRAGENVRSDIIEAILGK